MHRTEEFLADARSNEPGVTDPMISRIKHDGGVVRIFERLYGHFYGVRHLNVELNVAAGIHRPPYHIRPQWIENEQVVGVVDSSRVEADLQQPAFQEVIVVTE